MFKKIPGGKFMDITDRPKFWRLERSRWQENSYIVLLWWCFIFSVLKDGFFPLPGIHKTMGGLSTCQSLPEVSQGVWGRSDGLHGACWLHWVSNQTVCHLCLKLYHSGNAALSLLALTLVKKHLFINLWNFLSFLHFLMRLFINVWSHI